MGGSCSTQDEDAKQMCTQQTTSLNVFLFLEYVKRRHSQP